MGFISSWAQGIIIAVIIGTIIEMLLPSNGNGKYVKIIVGMFVLFSIVSPVVGKFKGGNAPEETSLETYLENSTQGEAIQTASINHNNEEYIRKMYEENLKVDIRSKISQKGYVVGDVRLDISNNEEYTLNRIEIKITGKNDTAGAGENVQDATTIVQNIENVKVSIGGSGKDEKQEEVSVISESEKGQLRDYLSRVYEVKEKDIIVY